MVNTPDWFNNNANHIWYPYTQMQNMSQPIIVKSTKGCEIILHDDTKLIDGVSSWWSTCHGYNHPHIISAVKEQLDKMPHIMFAGTAHESAYTLSGKLCKITGLDKAFLTDSGSTAVETAMKISVQYWRNKGEKRRNKFVSFKNGYHGDTMGCMSLCDPDKGMHKVLNDYMPKHYTVKLPKDEYDFSEFENLIKDFQGTIAGVIIEPLIQGAGGMRFHSADILAEIYRITKKYDLLFIADEIMTGFGRTGNMFACNEAAFVPDLMCIGKALTGGTMTLAAVMAKEFVFNEFLSDDLEKALMSGPTFMANPLACSAAIASIELFEQENRLEQAESIELKLYSLLKKFSRKKSVKDVRVKGAIGVIQIDADWPKIFELRNKFVKHGIWLRPFADVIYVMPPFIISDSELEKIVEAIDKEIE